MKRWSDSRELAELALKVARWRWEGDVPVEKKFVCVSYPHTSNWDGLLLVLMARHLGLNLRFMVKASWVRGPMETTMRSVGAIAIDRSKPHNVVETTDAECARADSMALFIPPEGTRGRTDGWKSGFYHIARGAGVPVVPGYLDYARRRAGMGPPVHLTGDVKADMDKLRAFYTAKGEVARHPERVGPIRLREEGSG